MEWEDLTLDGSRRLFNERQLQTYSHSPIFKSWGGVGQDPLPDLSTILLFYSYNIQDHDTSWSMHAT